MPSNLYTNSIDFSTTTATTQAFDALTNAFTRMSQTITVATSNTITFTSQYISNNTGGYYVPVRRTDVWGPYQAPAQPTNIETERAKRKARKLLKDNLSVAQWKDFLKLKYFEVIAQSGAVYRIAYGRSRNVYKIEDGEIVETLCAHPEIGCPNEDTMLAQKFFLETDEELFRKTANIDRHWKKTIPATYDEIVARLGGVMAA